ncbi:MAG: DNA polymerase Y family protein, partial [Pseudomonadota bacterium]
DDLDAGWGIDALRLAAPETEPMRPSQARTVDTGRNGNPATTEVDAMADLMSRIGNRIGFESVTRLLPAESHIPERAFTEAAAAWSERGDWRRAMVPGAPARPLTLFPPEPIAPTGPEPRDHTAAGSLRPPPRRFRWRAQTLSLAAVAGPERLAPEWWWDDPAWASGPRDYWRVATAEGPRLWLFHTPAAEAPVARRWHVHGCFA